MQAQFSGSEKHFIKEMGLFIQYSFIKLLYHFFFFFSSLSGFDVEDFALHLNRCQFAAIALVLLGGPVHLPAVKTARASLGEGFATQLTFIRPLPCRQ